MLHVAATEHLHYYYTFTPAVCRRFVEKSTSVSCQSSKEDLISGGKNFCIFVTRPSIKYAASRPSTYPIPTIKEVENEAIYNSYKVIKEEEIEAILDFTLRVEGGVLDEPHPKKMKVQLRGETSKNEVTCSTLKELLSEHNIIVDMGQLDEIPSVHSPFHRSQTDLFMYHKQFFKQKIVTGVVATSHADDSQDESDESDVEGLPKNTYVYTVAGVCEMKNSKKAVNQLIANMIHFGSQITVRALKEGEVVDQCITYGLGIDYQEKKARFMKLIMDLDNTKTIVEDYGVFPLPLVFNEVVSRLLTTK